MAIALVERAVHTRLCSFPRAQRSSSPTSGAGTTGVCLRSAGWRFESWGRRAPEVAWLDFRRRCRGRRNSAAWQLRIRRSPPFPAFVPVCDGRRGVLCGILVSLGCVSTQSIVGFSYFMKGTSGSSEFAANSSSVIDCPKLPVGYRDLLVCVLLSMSLWYRARSCSGVSSLFRFALSSLTFLLGFALSPLAFLFGDKSIELRVLACCRSFRERSHPNCGAWCRRWGRSNAGAGRATRMRRACLRQFVGVSTRFYFVYKAIGAFKEKTFVDEECLFL